MRLHEARKFKLYLFFAESAILHQQVRITDARSTTPQNENDNILIFNYNSTLPFITSNRASI